METVLITEDNLDEYEDILPQDIAENIGRENYSALAVLEDGDDTASGALVWEMKYLKDESKDTISELAYVTAEDLEAGEVLFSKYGQMVNRDEAQMSVLWLPSEEAADKEDLLEYAGFSLSEKEGRNMVVTVGDLSKLDIVKKTKLPSYIKELGTLMMRPFRRGIMNCIFHTKRELLEDLSTLPMEWYEPEVSCYVETDDKINGLLLVHKTPSGLLRLELMSAFGPDSRVDLLHMVRFSILQAVKLYPEDTRVILPRRDESAKKLSQYFFPKGQGVPSLYGERREV